MSLDIFQTLFGGSKSSNQAYPDIKAKFGPSADYTGEAGSAVSKFLGGDVSGFNAYKDATGFDFGAEEGSRGITGNAAAAGLLRSGPTSKALVRYGNDYQQQYAGNYLDQLLGLGKLGLGAGQLITSAGQVNKSQEKGVGSFLGSLLGFL